MFVSLFWNPAKENFNPRSFTESSDLHTSNFFQPFLIISDLNDMRIY